MPCDIHTMQPSPLTHRLLTGARLPLAAALCALSLLTSNPAAAAEGEMGVGIPGFGSYSAATGVETIVWSLQEAQLPLPAGCPYIKLTAATMGMDAYKIAVATLLMAKATGRAVRFYAHAARDGGCGVDYVQLN